MAERAGRPKPDERVIGPRLIVVTGIQAAGKSTIARMLAERFERGVHIEADLLYQMVVSGRVLPEKPREMSAEAARQLRLRLHNACLLARSFLDAGFSVVIDDIIIGERYGHLQEELAGVPFELVVLAPRPEVVVRQRDAQRGKATVIGGKWAAYLDSELRRTMSGIGIWIDSSEQTPEETVQTVAERLGVTA